MVLSIFMGPYPGKENQGKTWKRGRLGMEYSRREHIYILRCDGISSLK
jgi:hypothetical protein